MHTLLEYMAKTEGAAVLVAAIFMVSFIPFWRFLTEKEK